VLNFRKSLFSTDPTDLTHYKIILTFFKKYNQNKMHQYIRVDEGNLEYLSKCNKKNLVSEEIHCESSVLQQKASQRRAEYEEARDDVNTSDRCKGKAFTGTNRSVNVIDKLEHPLIVNNIKKTVDIKPKSATDEKKVLDASQTSKTLPPPYQQNGAHSS
jgi:hypothetical protein